MQQSCTAWEQSLSPLNSQLLNISRRSHEISVANAWSCLHAKWSSFLLLIAESIIMSHLESSGQWKTVSSDIVTLGWVSLSLPASEPIDKWYQVTDLIIYYELDTNQSLQWIVKLSDWLTTQIHLCICYDQIPWHIERLKIPLRH